MACFCQLATLMHVSTYFASAELRKVASHYTSNPHFQCPRNPHLCLLITKDPRPWHETFRPSSPLFHHDEKDDDDNGEAIGLKG